MTPEQPLRSRLHPIIPGMSSPVQAPPDQWVLKFLQDSERAWEAIVAAELADKAANAAVSTDRALRAAERTNRAFNLANLGAADAKRYAVWLKKIKEQGRAVNRHVCPGAGCEFCYAQRGDPKRQKI